MPAPIRFADLAITPWRNGAGRKADIATGDGWLIGVAFLDNDAPFSDYAGHDRTITLLDGAGFELDIAGRGVVRVDQPHVPVRFDGGAATMCRLLGGPCRVLNAMTERARLTHTVRIARGEVPPVESPVSLLVVLGGAARCHGAPLGMLDAIWLGGAVVTAEPETRLCGIDVFANRPPQAFAGHGG